MKESTMNGFTDLARNISGTFIGAIIGLAMSGAAHAADAPIPSPPAEPVKDGVSGWSLSFGSVLTTDYNFRGISQSDRKPAVQGTAEIAYSITPNFQIYANVFGSSLKLPSQAAMELDGSFGVRPTFGVLGFDFGATYYGYPGELPGVKSEFWEYYGKASYKLFDKLTIGAAVFHAPNWLNLNLPGTYFSATAGLDLPHGFALSGEFGHYALGSPLPDYNYWNAGISYTYKAATLDLRYHDTDLSRFQCQAIVAEPFKTRSKWCGPAFIASLKFNHSIENLFGGSRAVVARY